MHLFILFSILITLAATFSYINFRFFKLPPGIGLMVMGTIASLILIIAGQISFPLTEIVKQELLQFDFSEFVLGVLLSFLLFAGSLHVDFKLLKSSIKSVLSFALIGTLISTFLIGISAYFVFKQSGVNISFLPCLLFGALISPTDPVAVMGILKSANLSKSIEIKIVGESLLNDGIGVVIFATIMDMIISGVGNISITSVSILFLREAAGGIIMGLIIGYLGFLLMRSIDHFQTEILLSLAMVMGGYSLCHYLHVSGPLAMVVVGLITGSQGKNYGMKDNTRDYLLKFWEVIDEVLNAILFMLMGLEIIVISFNFKHIIIGLIIACLLLVVRYISLWIPASLFRFKNSLGNYALEIMTWGGLRGSISVALALSLPEDPYKRIFVPVTFVIVIFSVLVQGGSMGKLIKRLKLN